MSTWHVRPEGSTEAVEVPSAVRVLEGLRDGEWEPTDEVRGPTDRAWAAIENHPLFADAAAELEQRKPEPPDESRLDMNPLIDVALVLLIFFILTASYASLQRAIDLPPEPPGEGRSPTKIVKPDEIKDRAFNVKIDVGPDGKPVVTVEKKGIPLDDLERNSARS